MMARLMARVARPVVRALKLFFQDGFLIPYLIVCPLKRFNVFVEGRGHWVTIFRHKDTDVFPFKRKKNCFSEKISQNIWWNQQKPLTLHPQ